MRVEVLIAWPSHYRSCQLELAEGATVGEAIDAAALPGADQATAVAVHGLLATRQQVLRPDDRVELLRPLQADPKDARRRRAAPRPGAKRGA